MVYKTIIYNSKYYHCGEKINIFVIDKRVKIRGIICNYSLSRFDSLVKIQVGENLYIINFEKGEGYHPLEEFQNYISDKKEIFSISKERIGDNDYVILKIILEIDL